MVGGDGSAFSSQLIHGSTQNDISSLTIDRPTNFTHIDAACNNSQNNAPEGIIPPDIFVPAVMTANIANIAHLMTQITSNPRPLSPITVKTQSGCAWIQDNNKIQQ